MNTITQRAALSLFLALLAFGPIVAHAQAGGMKGMDMKDMDMSKGHKSTGRHKATGVVKKADVKAGTVTLDHAPVKSMNWPAMTMTFQVKDKALMKKLTENKRVDVEFEQRGKDYVITAAK